MKTRVKWGALAFSVCLAACAGEPREASEVVETPNTDADGATGPTGLGDAPAPDVHTAGEGGAEVAGELDTADGLDGEDPARDVGPQGGASLPEGLAGVPQGPPFKGPARFASVVDSGGQAVDAEELVGAPTVMWFFPLADTAG